MEPIRRQRASDSVYDLLRGAIISQVFKPGDRMNIHELASKLEVSLTPVKEALSRLSGDGLVEVRPRGGTFVTAIKPADVADTFRIRMALECLAAECAVPVCSDQEIARLRELALVGARVRATGESQIDGDQPNVDFHKYLVALSRNKRLIQIYESLNAHIQIARIHGSTTNLAARRAAEQEDHRAIAEAFASRDVAKALEVLRTHITRAAQLLVSDLRDQTEHKVASNVING